MYEKDVLMKEKQQPDKQGLHEWLDAMRQPLLRYCLQMTGKRWDAEDLVQDTMVRLIKARTERPEQVVGFRYACRTAHNLWIDNCRRAKRVTVVAQTDAAEQVTDSGKMSEGLYHLHTSADSGHAAMDVREHLEELAWRLQPKPFVILLLMEVFDFTAKETAAWLGGTEVAVQVALSRARSRLQSLSRLTHTDGYVGGKPADTVASGQAPILTAFFEDVLKAFRRRHPAAIQEAYLSLVAAGGQLHGIRVSTGKLYFTFMDPDGNVLMVSA